MDAVTINNLCYSYEQGKLVVDNVSLTIKKGSYVSLLGHNGSGKSTLAKLMIGLLPADSGTVVISGLELNDKNITAIRNKAAIVFQNPDNQFIGITVEDDIAFSLENRNVNRDEMQKLVLEYAKKVGMEEFLNKEPAYLSGGQKQRVAIADALVIKPEILILDEATSMLDPRGKRDILNLIQEMKKENPDLTVISITHDVEEAFLSDEIILLEKGRVVEQASPIILFSNQEIVNKYNLDVPFEIQVRNRLQKDGMNVGDDNILDEAMELLCQSK